MHANGIMDLKALSTSSGLQKEKMLLLLIILGNNA